jgi:biotin carboxyl carrier protein
MTFEIEVGGRLRAVAIEKAAGGTYRVTLDGETHEIDAARVGVFGLSLLHRGSGLSRDVQVTPASAAAELLVSMAGRTVAVTVNGRRSRRAGAEGGSADGVQSVTAPMPGRVVRVLVAPGDDVAARQGVVVVEAMKMENELRSPKAGRVREVNVAAGDSVEAGRVLLVVE